MFAYLAYCAARSHCDSLPVTFCMLSTVTELAVVEVPGLLI